jgi:rare lipoprotein A
MLKSYRRTCFLLTLIVCMLQTVEARSADDHASSSQSAGSKNDSESDKTFSGNASWYGAQFNGRKTASGEVFDMNKASAAHLHLPMVTKVLVENPRTGKSTVVRVNDRGPYHAKRVMDLSRKAAMDTGIFSSGVGYIECTILKGK